jgi:environmental stress-induced protein Ves
MPLTFRAAPDYRVMPWRNGLGTTVEMAREDGAGAAGFLWRLSRADVTQSGAFSNFPGIDRTLLLLSGAGFTLAFDGGETALTQPYQIARFAGDAPVDCTLHDGPCQDLNIMVDRARARAEVALCNTALSAEASSRTLLLALQGDWHFTCAGHEQNLPAESLVLLEDETGKPYRLRGSGILLRIDIEMPDVSAEPA